MTIPTTTSRPHDPTSTHKTAQVPIVNNFDDLLIPEDHVSRSPIDTYYVDDQNVLRTHTR